MKSTRALIPALAMLIISAVVMSTASYAWFSMNTAVTATGMQVTAKAESGIVISNSDLSAGWTAKASTTTSAAEVFPTSTSNFTAWYHSTSENANDANAGQTAQGAYVTIQAANYSDYFSASTFWIKSATSTAMDSTNLYIKSVTVAGASTEKALNSALRVGIKMSTSDTILIFAPISTETATATLSYKVNGATQVTAINAASSGTTPIYTATGVTSIPASDNGLSATVYVWFEGEDANCKSNNVTASLDKIEVSVQFSTTNA